jgi:GT2 family glycosyltransferase
MLEGTLRCDLSIVIVTYNGCEITLQTLDFYRRALAADTQHSYEIIVVDNASQDGVADAVEGYRMRGVCPLRLIRNADNVGFSAANNIGYEASAGRYLLFSNPDVEVTAETLPTLLNLLDRDPRVGACTPYMERVQTGDIDWGAHRGFPTPWAAFTYMSGLARLFRGSKKLSRLFGQYHLLDRDLTQAHQVDAIRGGFFLVRRDVFERAGRWDEAYFMYGEDIDLCFEIKTLGYQVMYYPQARVRHYHGMTTGLKEHSRGLSALDAEARERAYDSFYDTMKIFYDKHYRERYGALVRWFIFAAIDAKKWLGRRKQVV